MYSRMYRNYFAAGDLPRAGGPPEALWAACAPAARVARPSVLRPCQSRGGDSVEGFVQNIAYWEAIDKQLVWGKT